VSPEIRSGAPPPFRDVCAVLCNEPFLLTPEQVGQLTPWQAANLYLCPRDDKGRVLPAPPTPSQPAQRTPEDWFRRHWRANGLRPDLIDRLWERRNGS